MKKMKMKHLGIIALAAVLLALVTGCKHDPEPEPIPKTYTVTFNSNGGSSVNTQTVTEGGKVTEPQNVTKNRNTLDGWYNGGTKWNFSTNTVTSDLTLGAKWNLDQSLIASDFDGQNADSIFEVNSTAEWNTAIGAIQAGGDGKNYLINVNGNIVANPGRIFGTVSDIKVAIWGDKEISFSGTGPLFEIGGSENQVPVEQTVILRDLILCGRADNTEAGSLVSINYFGTLEMKGNTVISGNTVTGTTAVGVGVYVKGGKFIMEGGTISSNTGIYNWVGGGAGVSFSSVGLTILGEYRSFSPVFKKTGGIIYGYTAGDPLSNVMKDSGGNIKEDGGAALGLWGGVRRDKTVLPNHILECDGSTWVKWVDDDGVVTNQ